MGTTPCKLNTARTAPKCSSRPASDRIYSSTDCTDDKTFEETEYLLQPDDTQEIELTWDRTRSAEKCADVSAKPKPGTYKVAVTIGDIKAEPVQFQLS